MYTYNSICPPVSSWGAPRCDRPGVLNHVSLCLETYYYYTNTHTHTHTHTHTRTHAHAHTHTHTHIKCVESRFPVYLGAFLPESFLPLSFFVLYVCMYIYIYILCMCVCVYMYIYVYTHTHTYVCVYILVICVCVCVCRRGSYKPRTRATRVVVPPQNQVGVNVCIVP